MLIYGELLPAPISTSWYVMYIQLLIIKNQEKFLINITTTANFQITHIPEMLQFRRCTYHLAFEYKLSFISKAIR